MFRHILIFALSSRQQSSTEYLEGFFYARVLARLWKPSVRHPAVGKGGSRGYSGDDKGRHVLNGSGSSHVLVAVWRQNAYAGAVHSSYDFFGKYKIIIDLLLIVYRNNYLRQILENVMRPLKNSKMLKMASCCLEILKNVARCVG